MKLRLLHGLVNALRKLRADVFQDDRIGDWLSHGPKVPNSRSIRKGLVNTGMIRRWTNRVQSVTGRLSEVVEKSGRGLGMRRLTGLAVAAVAAVVIGPVAVAQTAGPTGNSSNEFCITIIGDQPSSGWTAATLKAAIENGTVAVGAIVPGPTSCGESAATPEPTTVAGDTGAWISSGITKDPITDKATVAIKVNATNATNSFGQKPELYIRCQDDTTDLFISWNDYLGSSDETTETAVRIDGGAVSTDAWANSTDGTAAFLLVVGGPQTFIKSLFGHDELVARVTPYNSAAVTATFPITGIENAVKDVRTTCNW